MKLKKKLIILTFFLSLSSCGFKSINSQDQNNFKIKNIEILGDNKFGYQFKNNINIYSKKDSPREYEVKLKLSNSKTIKIKNTSGKATRYTLLLNVDLELINLNQQKTFRKNIAITNDYDVESSHSETIKNEKETIKSNINYISDEIIKYIKFVNLN